jgi:periplasmic divalent cation tolerance protein
LSPGDVTERVQEGAPRPDALVLVISNAPDEKTALEIAQALVDEGLAACANVLAPCRSVYRWQGKVEQASEVPLLVKTAAARVPALIARVRELHPYELPEVITVPIVDGLRPYLDWVVDSTKAR